MAAVNQTAHVIDDVPAPATPAALAAASALERYPDGVIEEVSPRDHMFRVKERYLRAGQKALDCIRLGMVAAGKTGVASALDLPSGHGRVLRWIKAEFPDARLGAGDIDHDGVDFCAATFGATPVYGHEDPADIEIDAPYELIWCGSLFTHLPPERWEGFLALFERALVPEGLLVFTTHGRRIADRIRDPETGRQYLKEPARPRAGAERVRAGGARVLRLHVLGRVPRSRSRCRAATGSRSCALRSCARCSSAGPGCGSWASPRAASMGRTW